MQGSPSSRERARGGAGHGTKLLLSTAEPAAPAMAKTPSKTRSFSDSTVALSPSPILKEPPTKPRDDDVLIATPSKSPRRLSLHARGLTLSLPPRDPFHMSVSGHGRSHSAVQVDSREPYGSPSSVLPRHSRGFDFARACTNLHHSTLAESSPDASPTITQRNMMPRSRRASTHSMIIDSPRIAPGLGWSNSTSSNKGVLSSSVGSTNAMISDDSSSSSDDEVEPGAQDDMDDAVMTTPQLRKTESMNATTPFNIPGIPIPYASNSPSVGRAFSGFRQDRNRRNRNRNSMGNSDGFARPLNDEQLSAALENQANIGYFNLDTRMSSRSRRDSLNFGTRSLQISSNDSSEESSHAPTPTTPGVVRRPVTRRSNLLPKTKGFARIRAQLQEESAPVDSEVRREAEVVKQVLAAREMVVPSSPELFPSAPGLQTESSEMSEIEGLGLRDVSSSSNTAPDLRRGSNHKEFWPFLYNRTQTPPPPLFHRARSSSGMSEDVGMDSPHVSTPPSSVLSTVSTQMPDLKDDSETPQFQHPDPPSATHVLRKVNKRRRDEDFDPASIKRRAVSPGMSVQNSPVLGQSPVSNSGTWSGQPKQSRDGSNGGSTADERSTSSGSVGQATPTLGPKRVGLMGMTDTSDGVMKMSIE